MHGRLGSGSEARWHPGFVIETEAAAGCSRDKEPTERFSVFYPHDGIQEWFPRSDDPLCAQLSWRKRALPNHVVDAAAVSRAVVALEQPWA